MKKVAMWVLPIVAILSSGLSLVLTYAYRSGQEPPTIDFSIHPPAIAGTITHSDSGFPIAQYFDSQGSPLSAGLVYTYSAGTSTPLATFSDCSRSTINQNPIRLDSAGRARVVFQKGKAYRVVLTSGRDGYSHLPQGVQWVVDEIRQSGPFACE
jgi:hypothetical protein